MRLLSIISAVILLVSACQSPGTIGAGLLGNEELVLDFTDNININARVIPGDSTVINTFYPQMSIGSVDEPIFGSTVNQLFVSTEFAFLSTPKFVNGTLDSVILRIPLFASGMFGDSTAEHHVEVFQLENELKESIEELGDDLDSTTELPFGDKLGDTKFVANYFDDVKVLKHTDDDTVTLAPHLRVRLDDSFGEQFMGLTSIELNDENYQQMAKGFLIKSTPSADNMLSLNFDSQAGGGKLEFFYSNSDTTKLYTANLGISRFLNVKHDHDGSGSEVEAALNDTSDDQELLYLEPYAGSNIELDLNGLKDFKDKIINNVSLEFTLAQIADYDYELYPAMSNLSLSYLNDDGELRTISDITSASGVNSSVDNITNIESVFGGDLDEDATSGEMTYTMNITNHAIQFINGEFGDDYKLVMKAIFENSLPNRSIIHGNNTDGKGPKLKLVITEP